jgi:hypothetical protein
LERASLAYCLECEYYSEEVPDILLNFETGLTILEIKGSQLIHLKKKNEEMVRSILFSNEDPSANLGKVLDYGYTQKDYQRSYDYYRIAFSLSDDSGGDVWKLNSIIYHIPLWVEDRQSYSSLKYKVFTKALTATELKQF